MIKHSCRMKQFQLLNLLFILRLQNCGRNKNMLEGNSQFPGNTLKEGFLNHCFFMSLLEL